MRKILMILGLSLITGTSLFAQQNPACANPQLNPNPLAAVGSQFDLSFKVGNNGTVDILGNSATQIMTFTLTLGKCAPSVGGTVSTIGVNALSGDALNYFDVIYDAGAKTFYGTQKAGVAMGTVPNGLHTIVVRVQVTTASTNVTVNDIGGSMNVQPNAASSGVQTTSDDDVAVFTHTLNNPLPVTLNSFEARGADCAVALNWKTGTELRFDHFEIERGAGNGFAQIGSVKAKGDNSSYAFTDGKPATGINTYRLKMVDVDGSSIYSEIASAKANCPVLAAAIAVYPNPANAVVNVKGLKEGSTLRLMDVTGRMLLEKTNSRTTEILDLNRLPSALYTLQVIENGSLVTTVKVSKQ